MRDPSQQRVVLFAIAVIAANKSVSLGAQVRIVHACQPVGFEVEFAWYVVRSDLMWLKTCPKPLILFL